MNRLDELSLRMLDHDASSAELRELAKLNDGEQLASLVELEAELLASGRRSVEADVIITLDDERRGRVEDRVMALVNADDGYKHATIPSVQEPSGGRRPRLPRTVVGVAISLVIGFVGWWWLSGPSEPLPIATLVPHSDRVTVSSASVGAIDVHEGATVLVSGQRVSIDDASGSAEIQYRDGTRIELVGRTTVELMTGDNGEKFLRVLSGIVQAEVMPQPKECPLTIETDSATLHVLGTTLGVEVAEGSTQLEVGSGRVAMTRLADGQRVDVTAGHFARATKLSSDDLEPQPLPSLPDSLSLELANREAINRRGDRAASKRFAVTTNNAWQSGRHGLFQLHDDSVLHLRFRQERFARMTVMVACRAFPPAKGRFGVNLFYTRRAWNSDLPAGEWRTVSIPLSRVDWHIRRRQRENGTPALTGLAAYLIDVTTLEEDTGLVIDRMWVTRGDAQESSGEEADDE